MEEHGTIIRKDGDRVSIRATRTGACESCSSKKSCATAGAADAEVVVEAIDPVGVKVGDKVVFSVSAGSVLKAGALLYLFPILSFIAGVALGQSVFPRFLPGYHPDLVSGMAGAVFLAAAFGLLKGLSFLSERGRSFRPRVLRVE
ncbi:MAG: SoxR reducing system RseC family protein [Deltaproteobacteria bacterium]|nr:SoxR reducing system RseC family protein [Deltaproteobacteria bacterium]MBZ0220678.1 SoxR reducing system RseC family protein [Deltaproteobacteria bacterium]